MNDNHVLQKETMVSLCDHATLLVARNRLPLTSQKTVLSDGALTGRVEHTLHELLNHLLEYSEEAKSMLDDLRKACSLRGDRISSSLRILL